MNMYAKKIRLKYFDGISEYIKQLRRQGYKGEIRIY